MATSTDPELDLWSTPKTVFDYRKALNRLPPAMEFPGDPLTPWKDGRDGMWYTAIAVDGCTNATRDHVHGSACAAGGVEQLLKSPALQGPQAKWKLAGQLLQANRTAVPGFPQRTEYVTPDFAAPGSMPSSPTRDTAVFIASVYGPTPCCVHVTPEERWWNYNQYLVGTQAQAGGEFTIDWDRSGAMDYSSFTPNATRPGGLEMSLNPQWACCSKSASGPEGRRVVFQTGLQNGGSPGQGNATENAFALPREVFFNSAGP